MAENECPSSRRARVASSSWAPEGLGARRGGRSLSRRGPLSREERFLLDSANLNRLGALLALLNLELHPLSFVQGAVSRHLDLRLVDEEVLGAVIGDDEPEPLIAVEPLHNSCTHCSSHFGFTRQRQPESEEASRDPPRRVSGGKWTNASSFLPYAVSGWAGIQPKAIADAFSTRASTDLGSPWIHAIRFRERLDG